ARRARDREDSCAGCHMPLSNALDAIHIAVRDHRFLREPDAGSTAPGRGGSLLPLVRLNVEVGPEPPESMDRELAITVTGQGTRLPNTPQMRRVGRLVLSALDKAIAEHPDDLVALRMKGQALAFGGRHAEALRIAGSLLESTPSYELLLDDYTSYAIDLRNF